VTIFINGWRLLWAAKASSLLTLAKGRVSVEYFSKSIRFLNVKDESIDLC